jgi:hypothetical protein
MLPLRPRHFAISFDAIFADIYLPMFAAQIAALRQRRWRALFS